MGLFDFLKSKKEDKLLAGRSSYIDIDRNDADLRKLIRQAIEVFESSPGNVSHEQVIASINAHAKNEALALALYRFIPIAFCRIFIAEPEYADEFVLYKSKEDQQSFSLSKDHLYGLVLDESKAWLTKAGQGEKLMGVLVHSADFNAINTALKHGSQLKDLVLAPSYFV